MTDDTFTTAHKQIGNDFFGQNFAEGMFGVEGGQRTFTSNGEGTVIGTARATLPTSRRTVDRLAALPRGVDLQLELR